MSKTLVTVFNELVGIVDAMDDDDLTLEEVKAKLDAEYILTDKLKGQITYIYDSIQDSKDL